MKFPIFIEVYIKRLLEVDAKKLLDLPWSIIMRIVLCFLQVN